MDISLHDAIRGQTFEEKLASITSLLSTKRNIVVLAGAGISVSCGIPDFRSANGLYNTLNYQELGLASPEDLFDLETFIDDPRPFFKFAHSLYPGSIEPSASHRFLAWLDQQNKLLRIYTQNIDTLEQSAGVRSEKVVYAHGSLLDATCMKCKAKYSAADIASDVKSGTVPLCQRQRNKKAKLSSESMEEKKKEPTKSDLPVNIRRSSRRTSTKSASSEDNNNFEIARKQGLCCGVIKPNITFFGEKLGNNVGNSLQKDYKSADLLIVMGTSLSVAPMSNVVEFLPSNIPRILINRNIVSVTKKSDSDNSCLFHACLLGNCDDVVKALELKVKDHDSQAKTICGGLVASKEPWLQGQPKESVILFKGASNVETKEPETQAKLVVHCDQCQKEIEGKLFSCRTCFDYDLCGLCYATTSVMHADGKHEFQEEEC